MANKGGSLDHRIANSLADLKAARQVRFKTKSIETIACQSEERKLAKRLLEIRQKREKDLLIEQLNTRLSKEKQLLIAQINKKHRQKLNLEHKLIDYRQQEERLLEERLLEERLLAEKTIINRHFKDTQSRLKQIEEEQIKEKLLEANRLNERQTNERKQKNQELEEAEYQERILEDSLMNERFLEERTIQEQKLEDRLERQRKQVTLDIQAELDEVRSQYNSVDINKTASNISNTKPTRPRLNTELKKSSKKKKKTRSLVEETMYKCCVCNRIVIGFCYICKRCRDSAKCIGCMDKDPYCVCDRLLTISQ